MCGICGFTKANSDDYTMLKNMCDEMAHRGPDGEGFYINDNIALGHRRLSLVDLENGDQPIIRQNNNHKSNTWAGNKTNIDSRGDYSIVLNGEIYNYKEIKSILENKGYEFTTTSDTEVLLVGYIEWGEKVLNKLRGMFAFVVWDAKKHEFFCARDFFGIKPFYYYKKDDLFIFASEIKVLLKHKDCPKMVNENALEQYLCFQFSALQETFFKDIYTLPQGHYMIFKKNGETILKRYWRPKFEVDKKGKSCSTKDFKECYENQDKLTALIDDTMHESVKYHNIADVEVGSLLSSGIDSSYNAAILHKINPKMKTFTVGFDAFNGQKDTHHGEWNEIKWAQELSEKVNMQNYSKSITEEEYWNVLPKIAWHMDEPHGDPSAIALYFVDQIAAKHVKAVLSGEGADELFGGYTIYNACNEAKKLSWMPKTILKAAYKIAKKLNIRGTKYLSRAAYGVNNWYFTNAYQKAFNEEERKKLLKTPLKDIKSPIEICKNTYYEAEKDGIDDSAKMQYIDLHYWIIGDILLKGDKMSMAHSLECRVPFLDKKVFDVAAGISTTDKINNKQSKIALRRAAMSTIPQEWANKKKLGFPVPMSSWLREDKYYNKIKSEFVSDASKKFFNVDYLVQILDNHKNQIEDNSRKIWIVYMFLLWYKVFFEE